MPNKLALPALRSGRLARLGATRDFRHGLLSVGVGGQKKQVFDFYGTPDAVLRLEERVDTVSDSQRYTGRQPNLRLQPSAAGVR